MTAAVTPEISGPLRVGLWGTKVTNGLDATTRATVALPNECQRCSQPCCPNCWACCAALIGSLRLSLGSGHLGTGRRFWCLCLTDKLHAWLGGLPSQWTLPQSLIGSRLGVIYSCYLQPMQSFDSQICSLTVDTTY